MGRGGGRNTGAEGRFAVEGERGMGVGRDGKRGRVEIVEWWFSPGMEERGHSRDGGMGI